MHVPSKVDQQLAFNYDSLSLTEALGKAGLIAAGGPAVGKAIGEMIRNNDENAFMGGLNGSSFGMGRTDRPTAAGAAVGEAATILAGNSGIFGSGIDKAMLYSLGYAQNPQIEIIFNSVQNRTFLFDFKFTPRNAKEAQEVVQIIKAFRFHAAPEIVQDGGGRYFIPPSEFDIEFRFDGSQNKNLFKISTCVLEGIDVNYVTSEHFTTYSDGMPIEIAMQLRFKEVEILHKDLVNKGY